MLIPRGIRSVTVAATLVVMIYIPNRYKFSTITFGALGIF